MKRNKKLLIGAMALSLVLSTGAAAYAATDSADDQQKRAVPAAIAGMTEDQRDAVLQARIDSMEEAAAELVENGTITQETADTLTEFKEKQAAAKSGIGTLTEEQRTALRDSEAAALKSGIAELVDGGTITQEQADQMTQGRKMMKGLGLTDEQRDALMQVKEDALKAAVTELVEKGTLTEDEADAISSMQAARQSADKTAAEKPAGILTDDQRTALADEAKSIFKSKLADLVDDGAITQELADELQNSPGAMGMGMRMGPDGRGGRGLCPAAE